MNSGGAKINNSVAHHGSPSISPDGKFLFFFRHSIITDMDVYWVSTHVIDGLKKNVFAPKLSRQIPNMIVKRDSVIKYVIPRNTFSCEYGTETLKYTATLSNGSDLPSWLHFDSDTRMLSGTPTQAEIDDIKITATNKDSTSASCIFKITITNPTGIGKDNNQLPVELKLLQNYPNPFNPSTVIVYQLPAAGNVRISIFNLLGQKVKTFFNSFQSAGEHSLVWDGRDDSNIPVSSGMYFYRLETEETALVMKMVLLR
jgi:hypothetical protein